MTHVDRGSVALDELVSVWAGAMPQRGPLPYRWADELGELTPPEEMVEGVLHRGAMLVIYGESGSGKTYAALDMACHIAQGRTWMGRRTRRGLVLYVAAEAGESIGYRIKAWREAHGADDLPLAVVTCPVDLRGRPDVDRLIELIRTVEAERGERVCLCTVDTLSRAFGAGNENDSADMGALVANSDRIRHETGTAVAWVHHAGKDLLKGARGHSLLRAAADVELEVRNDSGVVTLRVTKARDGVTGAELSGRLRPLEVGVNSWGDPLSACVLEPVADAPRRGRRPAVKLGRDAKNALDALRAVVSEYGEPAPATSAIPPGSRVVTLDRWRARYFAVVTLDPTEDEREHVKAQAARRQAFKRAREQLLADEVVDTINDYWWIA